MVMVMVRVRIRIRVRVRVRIRVRVRVRVAVGFRVSFRWKGQKKRRKDERPFAFLLTLGTVEGTVGSADTADVVEQSFWNEEFMLLPAIPSSTLPKVGHQHK
jgi:hypothetical protein